MLTNARTFTREDRRALYWLPTVFSQLEREFLKEHPSLTVSEWQHLETIVKRGKPWGITRHNVNRLIDLGYVESLPSGGSGPLIRIRNLKPEKPIHQRSRCYPSIY